MKFQLAKNAGLHREGDKVYKPGDVIETEKPLDEIFVRTKKFIRVTEAGRERPSDSPLSKFGDDVTSVVQPRLLNGSFRVFKKGAWYNVVGISTNEPLNKKALRREEMEALIAELPDPAQDVDPEAIKEVVESDE